MSKMGRPSLKCRLGLHTWKPHLKQYSHPVTKLVPIFMPGPGLSINLVGTYEKTSAIHSAGRRCTICGKRS